MRKANHTTIIVIAIAAAAIAAAFLFLAGLWGWQGGTGASDPFAHLGNATFALIAPQGVMENSSQFIALAKERYNFSYANYSNATGAEGSRFVVIVANRSEAQYLRIAGAALNSTALNGALNYTKGVVISRGNVWADNQTVFLLIGYGNSSALQSALLGFFVSRPVHLPRQAGIRFVNFSGNANSVSRLRKAGGDPVMDAYLDGSYELGPYDKWLTAPYNYYDQFAYLLYWAPILVSGPLGAGGNSSGTGLPMHAMLCVPPLPPPDSTSLCIGEYFAMPMYQFGGAPPQAPQWSFDSGDCIWAEECIDAEGWAASGLSPQLPNQDIPSVYYGFTSTGSPIPPSMSGTSGPLGPWDPITWWYYGAGGSGLNTGGLVQNNISSQGAQSEISLLEAAGVKVFSAPYQETPFGNFTGYNSSNSSVSYSCGAGYCGAFFDYAIYALVNVSSTLPAAQASSTFGPNTSYYSIFQPLTLTAPKKVRSGSTTYYFSYWSVYSEVGSNQYYQRFNTSSATLEVVGPTQAQAIYTTGPAAPGSVSFVAETPGYTCSYGSAVCSIAGVNITFRGIGTGRIAYSNITVNSTGYLVTPQLQPGCYNVTADRPGFLFRVQGNPACVNGGGSVVIAMDPYLYIFNVSWPNTYPYGIAQANKTIPLSMSLLYYDGRCCASGVPLRISASEGSIATSVSNGIITPPPTSTGNGTVHFSWYTGHGSGPGRISFTVNGVRGLLVSNYTYSMPVEVFSGNYPETLLNISISNSTVHAAPGALFTDNITIRLCKTYVIGSNRTLPCIQLAPNPANMSLQFVNDRPANTTAAFTPNPAVVNANTLSGSTVLHMSIGSAARPGPYWVRIGATMRTINGTFNATALLLVYVSANGSTTSTTSTVTSTVPTTTTIGGGGSGYGALNVTVFFNGIPAGGAKVSATPGYTGWYTGSNGEYYTGFTIAPGNYEITGTYRNISNTTGGYVKVNAGSVSYAYVHIYGSSATSTTTTVPSTTTTSASTTSTSSATTTQQGYYNCNECYQVPLAGYSCPSNCPTKVSCSYGGFECV